MLTPSAALSAWTVASSGEGQVAAGSLGIGEIVDVAASGGEVTVSWVVSGLPAIADERHEVRRYPAGGGDPAAVQPHCSEEVGDDACTEVAVPPGEWEYAIVPRAGVAWLGAESPRSDPVTVAGLMSVAGLGGQANTAFLSWSAVAEVTVHDGAGAPLEGVSVDGDWDTNALIATTSSCVTGPAGTCEVTASGMYITNQATFTVVSLQRDGYDHDAGAGVHGSVTIQRNGTVTPS